jgi:predicted RNA binding protein with dsRBD fold (UPF0201 family)
MIYQLTAHIETPIHDTELDNQVVDAVTNLFPKVETTQTAGQLVGETHSLDSFADQLREQEILDTARREFTRTADADGFHFSLKKQAALMNVVNFAVGSSDELGEITVEVTVVEPSVDDVIDHIAPPTEDGEPLQQ